MELRLNNDFYKKCYKDHSNRPYHTYGIQNDRLKSEEHFYYLYPDFDISVYRSSNSDLKLLSDYHLIDHYHRCGKNEKRKYKRSDASLQKQNGLSNPSNPSNPSNLLNKYQISELYPEEYLNTVNISKIIRHELYDSLIQKDLFLNSVKNLFTNPNKDFKNVYLVINEWGYPPYGGGECWLIDTIKWMSEVGYNCYFIYFSKADKLIEMKYHDGIKYISMQFNKKNLYSIVKYINPLIVSHQGRYRLDIMNVCKILGIRFVSGFCFWNDIIEYKSGEVYNYKLMEKNLKETTTFKKILKDSSYLYSCSEFVNDIINKVYNTQLPVIHTISDISSYKEDSYYRHKTSNSASTSASTSTSTSSSISTERKYVTIINISKCYSKENFLLKILENVDSNIPFYIIDSQGSNDKLICDIKNVFSKKNKPVKDIIVREHIDLNEVYKQTKILLILSLVDETFCRTAYEGMNLGIPIISTKNGNLKYLLENYADFLDDKSKKWYHHINSIYNNDKLLLEMSNRPCKTYSNTKSLFLSKMNDLLKNPLSIKEKLNISGISGISNICIYCPWADQGLGIQSREYYKQLKQMNFSVKILSHKPYIAKQTDPNEWIIDKNDIFYLNKYRDEITFDDFEEYVREYQINIIIIVEFSDEKLITMLEWTKLLNIKSICIPNIEILKYTEVHYLNNFNVVCTNNTSTYEILKKIGIKTKLINLGFGLASYSTSFDVEYIPSTKEHNKIEFFCCGGFNSFTRKNINKIINTFNKINSSSYILHVYIQDSSISSSSSSSSISYKNTENIFYHVKNISYKEILSLYTKHDVFIHLGDHEGLGLGFHESLYYNCPVVTINCPPNNEIINEFNGYLIDCTYTEMTDNIQGIVKKSVVNENDIYKVIKSISFANIAELKNNIANQIPNYDKYLKTWIDVLINL